MYPTQTLKLKIIMAFNQLISKIGITGQWIGDTPEWHRWCEEIAHWLGGQALVTEAWGKAQCL